MKKLLLLGLIAITAACASEPKETYPYGMTAKEWNALSIKDQANIRRDFYFYEKGSTSFVNPQLEVEGKKEEPNMFVTPRKTRQPAKPATSEPAPLVE